MNYFMSKLSTYFNFTSLSWWSGVGLIVLGTMEILGYTGTWINAGNQLALEVAGMSMTGAGKIVFGLGFVGIRAKLSRIHSEVKGTAP